MIPTGRVDGSDGHTGTIVLNISSSSFLFIFLKVKSDCLKGFFFFGIVRKLSCGATTSGSIYFSDFLLIVLKSDEDTATPKDVRVSES
jgi:hypothetical protein